MLPFGLSIGLDFFDQSTYALTGDWTCQHINETTAFHPFPRFDSHWLHFWIFVYFSASFEFLHGLILPSNIFKLIPTLPFPPIFMCFLHFQFKYFHHIQKFIKNWKQVQIIPNFFLHDPWSVYYFLVVISWFYLFWILNCDWFFEHVCKCDIASFFLVWNAQ